jgi:hypothetical protein
MRGAIMAAGPFLGYFFWASKKSNKQQDGTSKKKAALEKEEIPVGGLKSMNNKPLQAQKHSNAFSAFAAVHSLFQRLLPHTIKYTTGWLYPELTLISKKFQQTNHAFPFSHHKRF